jgi:UDP-GlcNAc:undecaprenyl-phosphate/decaprenyl-phosphate GlcNAc-1-phosphate transferase
MYSLLFLGLVSFLVSLVATPYIRNTFRRWNIVDDPDNHRKIHKESIPRVGGIAIALAYVVSFAALGISSLKAGTWMREHVWSATHLLPAVGLVFAVGLIDDLYQLKPWQKLLGQIVGALLAYQGGVHLDRVAGVDIPTFAAVPLTVFWLLACSNAFNLIDGVDGLAAGVGLFAALTTLVAALLGQNIALAFLIAPLVGGLIGFLRYNFNPASIFLGDCGSLFIGFLLGCYGALWAQKSATILGVTAPLMAMAIPLLDTSLAIARRFLRGQPIFTADRAHIHHKLLAKGMSSRGVALILYAVGGVFAALSLLVTRVQDQYSGLVIVLFCVVTWVGIQHLGYLEFGTASRMLIGGAFRRLLNSQMMLSHYEVELKAAVTEEECWAVLARNYRVFGFSAAELHLAGTHRVERYESGDHALCWTMRLDMPNGDWVILSRPCEAQGNSTMVAQFADVTQRLLATKSWAENERGAVAVSA